MFFSPGIDLIVPFNSPLAASSRGGCMVGATGRSPLHHISGCRPLRHLNRTKS
ncbi:MAG: hypothetical protein ACFE9C_15675 [Candidatus Hodarchaeota archaeon]